MGLKSACPPIPLRSSASEDAPTFARDKFGNQKAISSDMYFGRNSYDPAAQAEAQTRLQSFQGAQSISSNQYFGREEEEDGPGGMGAGPDGGVLGDGSLAGLEIAARDAISRVLANPDVQNVGESIRAGALKVRATYWVYVYARVVVLTRAFHAALGLPRADVGAVVASSSARMRTYTYVGGARGLGWEKLE